jgi:micrococcal nuclease
VFTHRDAEEAVRRLSLFDHHPLSFRQAQQMRAFRGVVNAIIDGDTYSVVLDVGFYVYPVIEVRLKDVNTPEIVGAERERGLAAREFVRSVLDGKPVVVTTELDATGQDKMSFVRYVADVGIVSIENGRTTITILAQLIQEAGFDLLHPVTP